MSLQERHSVVRRELLSSKDRADMTVEHQRNRIGGAGRGTSHLVTFLYSTHPKNKKSVALFETGSGAVVFNVCC